LAQARERGAEANLEEQTRQAITTKHDKSRLLHLRCDPGASADWTEALREKTRPQLDTHAPAADPWSRLAEKFNDYNTYRYQNACILPNQLDPATGTYVPVPGMESIAEHCYMFNPNMPGRPNRDAGWLRVNYRELKGKITICFTNVNRSGNQENENIYDEWVKFSTSFSNDVVTYARCLFQDEEMDQLGRALPTDVQRDTGATDPEDTYEKRVASASARKRQRKEANRAADSGGSQISEMGEREGEGSLAAVLQQGLQDSNKIAGLRVLMEMGSAEDKAAAIEKLRELLNN
ncbi:hypothetical protein B484DRAFT_439691, partial [Ochromonadaceae sp. CCMP2298]